MTSSPPPPFLDVRERKQGCQARRTQDQAWHRHSGRSGNFQSASRGRQRAAWDSQGHTPRSPELSWLGRLPGQESTCPISLRFEKGLPYSLPLGFLGATRGVRGRVSFNPISTWMGSAGHSNPSSSDFLGWGGVVSHKGKDPLHAPTLTQAWMASRTSGSRGVPTPWYPGQFPAFPWTGSRRATKALRQSSGPGFACALGLQPAGSRHCKSLALLVGLCPPALDQCWQGHICWGKGWDRQLSELQRSPFRPVRGCAPLHVTLRLPHACSGGALSLLVFSLLQVQILTFFRDLLIFYRSFINSSIHSFSKYLLSSYYAPGPC